MIGPVESPEDAGATLDATGDVLLKDELAELVANTDVPTLEDGAVTGPVERAGEDEFVYGNPELDGRGTPLDAKLPVDRGTEVGEEMPVEGAEAEDDGAPVENGAVPEPGNVELREDVEKL